MSKGLYELAYGDWCDSRGELYGGDGKITVEAETYQEAIGIALKRLPPCKSGKNRWFFRMLSCTDTAIRKVIPDQTNIDASTTLVAGKVKF